MTKPHYSRGFCRTCYHKWLADNNPEYKEKLRIKKREQKKRREKRRVLELNEAKQSAIRKTLVDLASKYIKAESISEKILTETSSEAKKEKESFPNIIEYLEKLEKKLKFFPAISYICPNCKTKFLYEKAKKKSKPLSTKTCQLCPKCGYDPSNSMNCAICNKVFHRWVEGNHIWCNDCDNKLRQKHRDRMEKFCCKCGAVLPKSDFSWQTSKLGFLDESCQSSVCICDKCEAQFDANEGLRLDNKRQVWLEIDDDRVCGELPHLSLLFITPINGIKYLKKSNYLNRVNIILNLKLLANLSLELDDFNYNPDFNKFSGQNKNRIIKRFNEKVMLYGQENKVNYLRQFIEKRSFISNLFKSQSQLDYVCSDTFTASEWNNLGETLKKEIKNHNSSK